MPGDGLGTDEFKRRQQFMQMRGAQMVEQQTGRTAADGITRKAKGSRKQLIGTIVGIIVVVAVLAILSRL